jgi:fatty acid synthase subunit beta
VQSQVTYKDKTSYRNVSVSGDIFVRDQLKLSVKVESVDFQQDDCQGNPVVVYLLRHGNPQGSLTLLVNDAHTLSKDRSTVFITPLTNEPTLKYPATSIPSTSIPISQTTRPWHNHTRYVVERRYSEVR